MTAPRTPEQRARFVRSVAADLDVAPELAERLLFLSESARAHARSGGTAPDDVRALLECLMDDDVCGYGWRIVDADDPALWRLLLRTARPPRDVGPAVLLAFAVVRGGAIAEASGVLAGAVRPGEFRRSSIELAADLAEDAGDARRAWSHVRRLSLEEQAADWDALRCVLGCSRSGRCDRGRLHGVVHARWLRQRIARWARRPWSAPAAPAQAGPAGYLAARRAVLPPRERDLLSRWVDTAPEFVTVHETGPWEAVVEGLDGQRRRAGWESAAPGGLAPGAPLLCRLLPTLVPAEHLIVRPTLEWSP